MSTIRNRKPSASLLTLFLQTSIASLCLLVWMHYHFLSPLKTWAVEMAHLDPTEIIVAPYPVGRLGVHVCATVLFSAMLSIAWWDPTTIFQHTQALLWTTMIIMIVFVLCGAHPVRHFQHTMLASLYVAALLLHSTQHDDDTPSWMHLKRIVFPVWAQEENASTSTHVSNTHGIRSQFDCIAVSRVYGTVLTMIPFQVLLVLDGGYQTQRWPVSLVLSSTCGWVLGGLFGLSWTTCKTPDVTGSSSSTQKAI